AMADTSLIARKIAEMRIHIVATPAALAQFGRPQSAEDWRTRPCIIDVNLQGQANWRFIEGGKPVSVHVTGPVKVNSPMAAMQAALAGLGFAALPSYLADPEIRAGRL